MVRQAKFSISQQHIGPLILGESQFTPSPESIYFIHFAMRYPVVYIHNFRTRFRNPNLLQRTQDQKKFQRCRKSFKQKDLYCSGVLFQARNYLLSNKLYDGNIILAVNEWSFSGYFRQIGTYNLHLRKHVHKQNRMAGTALLALAFRSY